MCSQSECVARDAARNSRHKLDVASECLQRFDAGSLHQFNHGCPRSQVAHNPGGAETLGLRVDATCIATIHKPGNQGLIERDVILSEHEPFSG